MTAAVLLQALVSGLMMGCVYALIAVGLSLIFGVMEIVNFAHGEHLMLAMYGAYFLWSVLGLDPLLALPLLLVGMGAVGGLTYRLLIKRVYEGPMLAQIIATFGLSIFLSSLAQFLWGADYRSVRNPWLEGRIALGPVFVSQAELAGAVIALITFAALYWFLHHTEIGLALRATSEDKQTAFLIGIDGDRMFTMGWVIGLACVGVAGGVLSMFYYVFPTVGSSFAILTYFAVALGGFGNVLGGFVGGALIGVVEAASGMLINPALKYAGVFLVYVLVVAFRPQGLLGRF